MTGESQAIVSPFGITVFGSAVSRVSPDVATIRFAVSRREEQPAEAFQKSRSAAKAVAEFLRGAGITDFGTSRVSIEEDYERNLEDRTREFVGYRAAIGFELLIHDLDRIDEVVAGVVEAGANGVGSPSFQTTEIKAVRESVRKRAVEAAREKALLYCSAAGVGLGKVLHIEDQNPDYHGGSYHASAPASYDDEGELRAIDPGAITVAGAVRVSYEIVSA